MLNNRDKEVGLITNSSFFSRIESEEIDSKHSKKMNFDFLKKMSRGISNKMENNDKLYEFQPKSKIFGQHQFTCESKKGSERECYFSFVDRQ